MRTNNKILPLEVSRLNYEINGHKLIENLNFKLDTVPIPVKLITFIPLFAAVAHVDESNPSGVPSPSLYIFVVTVTPEDVE